MTYNQGAWVQTQTGEDWFIHFQDKGAYGRIVHLQPMKWINDWPVIGNDEDKNGIGEFLKILDAMKYFDRIDFGWEDIVRSGLVRDFLMTKELVETGKL